MSSPNVAIAVPFTWTHDASFDLRMAFASGASPVDVIVADGTYRTNLAGTTGVLDFLRMLEGAINTALSGAARTEVATVSISTEGIVSIALTQPATWTLTTALRDQLGCTGTSYSSRTTVTADYPPRDFYVFCGGDSEGWKRSEPIAGGMTVAGGSYLVRSGIVTEDDSIALEHIPGDPTLGAASGETWTPWEAGASTVPYACARLLTTAGGVTVAFARYWQDVRASLSEPFDLVTIPPDALSKPDVRQQFPMWTMFKAWNLPLVRTGTSTRA